MAFHNLSGGKELSTHKSTAYKQLVIQYLQAFNYILIKDSDHHGSTSDLIFKRVQVDGNKETHVEAKDTKQGLGDKDFLGEITKYLRIWKSKGGIYFHIFASKCVNQRKWDLIFDETKQNEEAMKAFYKVVLENAPKDIFDEVNSITYEEFENFIRDTDVYQSTYVDLMRETDRAKKAEHFNIDPTLLEDHANLITRAEELIVNGIGIHQDSIPLHWAKLKGKVSKDELYCHVGTCHLAKDFIISLDQIPDNEDTKKLIDLSTVTSLTYSAWKEEEDLKAYCLKILLKKYIIFQFKKKGAKYNDELDLIYFEHLKATEDERRYILKRFVARSFYKDNKLNFVRHRALSIKINKMEDEFLAFFNIGQLFSQNGSLLITGTDASRLHHKFVDRNANNGMERSLVNYWIYLFRFFKNRNEHHVKFLAPKKISFPYQYEGGKQFTEDLSMFFSEEENEV